MKNEIKKNDSFVTVYKTCTIIQHKKNKEAIPSPRNVMFSVMLVLVPFTSVAFAIIVVFFSVCVRFHGWNALGYTQFLAAGNARLCCLLQSLDDFMIISHLNTLNGASHDIFEQHRRREAPEINVFPLLSARTLTHARCGGGAFYSARCTGSQ